MVIVYHSEESILPNSLQVFKTAVQIPSLRLNPIFFVCVCVCLHICVYISTSLHVYKARGELAIVVIEVLFSVSLFPYSLCLSWNRDSNCPETCQTGSAGYPVTSRNLESALFFFFFSLWKLRKGLKDVLGEEEGKTSLRCTNYMQYANMLMG